MEDQSAVPEVPPVGAPPAPITPSSQPKKGRTTLIIVIAVVLLACCAVSACAIALLGMGFLGDGETRAAVEEADTHIEAAFEIVEAVGAELDALEESDRFGEQIAAVAAESRTRLEDAHAELDAAGDTIRALSEGEIRSTYLEALEELRSAVRVFEDVFDFLVDNGTAIQAAVDAADLQDEGLDLLNQAINQANRRDYDDSETNSRAAVEKFGAAASLFASAHSSIPSAGLDRAVTYMNELQEVSRIQVEIAEFGRANRVNDYNRALERIDAIHAASEGDPLWDIFDDPEWLLGRLDAMEQQVMDHIDEAVHLRERVDDLLD